MNEPAHKLKITSHLVFWSGTICCIANGLTVGPWYLWCTVGIAASYLVALLLSAFGEFLDYVESTDTKLDALTKAVRESVRAAQISDRIIESLTTLSKLKESGAVTEEEYRALKELLLTGGSGEAENEGND